MLWTSQGAFFSAICERVARAEDRETPDVTAELAGRFALVFLAMEAVIRASATLLTKYVQLDFATVFYIFSALAVLSTLSFQALATEMGAAAPRGSLCAKAFSAIAQWKDPKTWATRIKSEELFGAFCSLLYMSCHREDLRMQSRTIDRLCSACMRAWASRAPRVGIQLASEVRMTQTAYAQPRT